MFMKSVEFVFLILAFLLTTSCGKLIHENLENSLPSTLQSSDNLLAQTSPNKNIKKAKLKNKNHLKKQHSKSQDSLLQCKEQRKIEKVSVLKKDVSGNLFVGTDVGLGILFQGKGLWDFKTTKDGLPPGSVQDIFIDDQTLYLVATGGVGMASIENRSLGEMTTLEGIGENPVRLAIGPNSWLYVATSMGLYISMDGGISFEKRGASHGIKSLRINDLFVDLNNDVYLATEDGLSVSINDGVSFDHFGTKDGLPSQRCLAVYVEPGGTLLVGTDKGLAQSTSSSHRRSFQKVGLDNDLGEIYDIVQDELGMIYLATDKGLAISTDGGSTFVIRQTAKDKSKKLLQNVYIDAQGKLYMAGNNGISISSDSGLTFKSYPIRQCK